MSPQVWLDGWGSSAGGWRFNGYQQTLIAWHPSEVSDILQQAEAATEQGFYAVGFVAYEAAQALNPYLPALPPREKLPLAWFALYIQRLPSPPHAAPAGHHHLHPLVPSLTLEEHAAAVARLHRAIAAGESYQVNFTFPLSGTCSAGANERYQAMLATQPTPFGARLDIGRHTILSASPELFFHREGDHITTRPMKGTAPRGRFPAEDTARLHDLAASPKEQAENLMIVDLLRNDLGQIAITGSVQVERLFEQEQYPTVHQLTSTITARLLPGTRLVTIFRALFPCGSVTGAPKRRSMELIAETEGGPRGVYCGAIGMLSPSGEALFSVAIRTAVLDHETGRLTMAVGSGITWEAKPEAEYAECLAKAAFLSAPQPPNLLESLRLENGSYPLLTLHLKRLAWSAGRLGHRLDLLAAERALRGHAAHASGVRKVRLLLAPDGRLTVASEPIRPDNAPLRLALSATQVDPDDQALYLKTEDRERYERARREHPTADEVLLTNRQGELTEGSYHNLVLRLDNRLVTPPLTCGLLPGVMRQALLDQGIVTEQVLYPTDLKRAETIWLINAVRGWRRGQLASDAPS